jgi:hypothetical protein
VTATIYGTVCGERDIAVYSDGSAESFDRLIAELPDDGVKLTIGHDADLEIGELVFGEIDRAGILRCTCVIDDSDWLLDYPADVFYSAELIVAGEGVATRSRFVADAAALTGLSLVSDPATLAAQPIKILPGDVRSSADRYGWPIGWAGDHPLLKRSLDELGDNYAARSRIARRLLDRRDQDRPPTPLLRRRSAEVWHGAPGAILRIH